MLHNKHLCFVVQHNFDEFRCSRGPFMYILGTKIRTYDSTLPTNNGLQYSPLEAYDFVRSLYRLEKMTKEVLLF